MHGYSENPKFYPDYSPEIQIITKGMPFLLTIFALGYLPTLSGEVARQRVDMEGLGDESDWGT